MHAVEKLAVVEVGGALFMFEHKVVSCLDGWPAALSSEPHTGKLQTYRKRVLSAL
jgi:hypothetical protein